MTDRQKRDAEIAEGLEEIRKFDNKCMKDKIYPLLVKEYVEISCQHWGQRESGVLTKDDETYEDDLICGLSVKKGSYVLYPASAKRPKLADRVDLPKELNGKPVFYREHDPEDPWQVYYLVTTEMP